MKNKLYVLTTLLIVGVSVMSACTNAEDSTYNVDTGLTETNKKITPTETKLGLITPNAYTNISDLNVDKGMNLSFIAQEKESPYWKEVKAGAMKAIEDINAHLGYSGNDKLTLDFNAPSEKGSVEQQVNILDEEAARYPLALGISTADTNAFEVQLDLAIENGIPIVAFDSLTDYANISATIGADQATMSTEAMRNLAQSMDGTGRLLLLSSRINSDIADPRVTAIANLLTTEFPEIELITHINLADTKALKETIVTEHNFGIVEESQITVDDVSDEDLITYYLEQHQDISGFLTLDGKAHDSLITALDTAKKDYEFFSIVTMGGSASQTADLKADKIEGLYIQNPYGTGYATVVASMRAALGLANESFIDTGYELVTKDNMDIEKIKHLLYDVK